MECGCYLMLVGFGSGLLLIFLGVIGILVGGNGTQGGLMFVGLGIGLWIVTALGFVIACKEQDRREDERLGRRKPRD